jgi:GntR family transcriptional regulator
MTIAGAGPLYTQVRELMIEKIHTGQWKPGQLIPSETRLAVDLGVSQGTVRKAIGQMVTQNVLVRQQGKGTFVATHDSRRALFHFFHIVPDDGVKTLPQSLTLSNRRREASREEARALKIPPAEAVVRIERLRRMEGNTVIAENITVPAGLFSGLHELPARKVPNTLYELFERAHGITIHRAEEKIKAVTATARLARLLGVEQGEALLRIERIAYTLSGTPVEFRVTYCATANHHYANNLT